MSELRSIVMLGTALDTRGGISAVVKVYRRGGVFDRWPVVYIATHTDQGFWPKLWLAVSGFLRFVCWVLRRRVALVHVHTASSASFWRKSVFMALALLVRSPIVLHVHGGGFIEFYEHECGWLRKGLVRLFFNRVAQVVVLSAEWRFKVASITSNVNIVPIFNPVQVETMTEGGRKEAHTLLFLGRLNREKGIYDLLEAVAQLRGEFPDICLLCGGDGDLAEVKKKAEVLGLSDSVRLLGWVDDEAKRRVLAEAAVYVLPSYYEGLPMGVLEAMSAGLPVVSTVVGGIPEAVTEGVEGYLVLPGDVKKLVAVLQDLLRDAELRERMGLAGKKKIREHFASPVILPQIEAVYRRLGAVPTQQRPL